MSEVRRFYTDLTRFPSPIYKQVGKQLQFTLIIYIYFVYLLYPHIISLTGTSPTNRSRLVEENANFMINIVPDCPLIVDSFIAWEMVKQFSTLYYIVFRTEAGSPFSGCVEGKCKVYAGDGRWTQGK